MPSSPSAGVISFMYTRRRKVEVTSKAASAGAIRVTCSCCQVASLASAASLSGDGTRVHTIRLASTHTDELTVPLFACLLDDVGTDRLAAAACFDPPPQGA